MIEVKKTEPERGALEAYDRIKEAAKTYWAMGLPVVPVKGKRPLVQWAKWQRNPQTFKEFESLPWDKADGFGVLCGLKGKNGLYLAVIDIDKADFDLTLLRTTQIDRTPSGGYHYVYWSREPVEAVKRIDLGVELLGFGNICIMAPSKGYVRLTDNPPTEVDSAKTLFNQLIVKLGGKPKREIVDVKRLLKGVKVGERDNAAIRLATWYRKKGLSPEETLKKLLEWDQRNEAPLGLKTLKEKVKSAFKLPEPYSWIFSEEPKRKRIKHVPFVELPDGWLAEQAYDGEKTYFLVFNPTTGSVDKLEEIETEDTIYRTVRNSDVENFLTLFPSQAEEYENEEKLFQEVVDFMNRWHEAPNERERKLDALYVFLTYVYDLLPRIPYRRALGAYGRGKSAWLQTVGFICYRPIILAGCDTDKAIVRRINLWKGTALIDEADFNNSTLYSFIIKILEIGYDRKFGFYQRAHDVDPQKTLNYYVYGPKLLATRKEFKDVALESRCLTFIAREKTKPMPLYRDKKFMEEAQALRNKLILWRFRKYHELKEKTRLLEKPDFEREFKELNISSRIKEIIAPLTLINPSFKPVINELANELDELLKTDPDVQLEQAFNEALIKIYDELEEEEVEGGRGEEGLLGAPYATAGKQTLTNYVKKRKDEIILQIPLVKIAKIILDDPEPDPNELKGLNQKLSRIVKTRLGFKVKKIRGRSYVEIPLTYRPSIPLSPSTHQVKTILLNDSLPKDKVPMRHLTFQLAKAGLVAFLNKIKLAKLQWEVNKIKAKGIWIEKNGYFIGSLNHKYSRNFLLNLAEKLPLLLHNPDEKPREKPIAVSPETTIKELFSMIKEANERQCKTIIFRPKWACVLPPFNFSELLRGLLPVPEDILICDLLNLRPLSVQFKEIEKSIRIPLRAFTIETVPGCFGRYGRPIPFWQFGCSMCVWEKQCLQQTIADMRRNWHETIEVRKCGHYAYISVNLMFTPFKLNAKGQKKMQKLITQYITQHWNCRSIRKQLFTVNGEYVSFKVFKKDAEEITKEVAEVLSKYAEVQVIYSEDGKTGR